MHSATFEISPMAMVLKLKRGPQLGNYGLCSLPIWCQNKWTQLARAPEPLSHVPLKATLSRSLPAIRAHSALSSSVAALAESLLELLSLG